jgi:hypothetical protein
MTGATEKQRLLSEACRLFGTKAVAQEMKVSEELLAAWIKGDATMPDGQLLRLSAALLKLASQK